MVTLHARLLTCCSSEEYYSNLVLIWTF